MDERCAGLSQYAFARALAICKRRLTERDLPAVAGNRGTLGPRSIVRHDNVGANAAQACSPRECGGMISRGMRDDTALRLLIGEQKNRISRTTRLESSHSLEVFAFEDKLGVRGGVQRGACQRRGAIDLVLDARACFADERERQAHVVPPARSDQVCTDAWGGCT